MCGISHWYKAKFEKLGWMILAKEHGYTDKVEEYKNSLKRLEEAIKHRMKHMVDPDKKMDLQIMLKNLKILMKHVKSDRL
jgi:hypothetical protein